jgi:hypothetical protein
MKKILSTLFMVIALGMFAMAQPPEGGAPPRKGGGGPAHMEVLKVAYVTKYLSLTPEEAEKFWPLYNGYTDDVRKARFENKEDILAFEEALLNIRKKYRQDLKKILNSDERANKALAAEREFNNVVRSELQKRMEMRKKMRPQDGGTPPKDQKEQ